MLPTLASAGPAPHCGDLFAMPWEQLFDRAARGVAEPVELPPWSALRLHALAHRAGEAPTGAAARIPLSELEDAAIRDAVTQQARGNDAQAGKTLGISRTTVYRKLHR
jgi:transcriptional regulator of acetoin/glycerol metabolism